MPKAHTRCTGTKVTLADGGEFLVVDVEIDCDICGRQRFRVAGHHLRAIRNGLIELMDLHPTLTGKDDDVQTLERLQFQGRYPGDPTQN
jgi:hypothetical protein